jgi:hypothetical protein
MNLIKSLESIASRYIMKRTFPPLVMAEIMLTGLFLATNRITAFCPFGAKPLTRFAPVWIPVSSPQCISAFSCFAREAMRG